MRKFKSVVPKKYRTKTFVDLRFTIDVEEFKSLYLHMQKQGVDELHLLREVFYKMMKEENKKYSQAVLKEKTDEFIAFEKIKTDIKPRRHFNIPLTEEKLRVYKLFQVLQKKMSNYPVSPKLAWLYRDKIDFKDEDILIFEDCLHQLVEETRLQEIQTELANGKVTSKFRTSVTLTTKKFSEKYDNPFYKKDLEMSAKAEQNVKEGRNAVITRKRKL